MSQPFSIQPYLTDLKILHETAEQIKKDFSFFQIDILFILTDANLYEDMYQQIFPAIKNISSTNYQQLIALLYRVDISEKQIIAEQQNNSQQTFEQTISHLIIKRCLQKVVLRKLFS